MLKGTELNVLDQTELMKQHELDSLLKRVERRGLFCPFFRPFGYVTFPNYGVTNPPGG